MNDEFRPHYPGEVDPTDFFNALGEGRAAQAKAPKVQESVESVPGADKLTEAFREFMKAGAKVLSILEKRSTR